MALSNEDKAKLAAIKAARLKREGRQRPAQGLRDDPFAGLETKPSEQWRADMISAQELCGMRFEPLKFIVPRVIPEGSSPGGPRSAKAGWLCRSALCWQTVLPHSASITA